MTPPSEDVPPPIDASPSEGNASTEKAESLSWTGYWKVLRWDDQSPTVPTYYVVTPERWDVAKADGEALSVAPHPILEANKTTVVLKDEGADDTDRERWRAEVSGDRLTVTALTGPHEGAVGVAKRIQTSPPEAIGDDEAMEDA